MKICYIKINVGNFYESKGSLFLDFTVFKGDSLALQRQILDPNVLNRPMFHG